MRRIRGRLLTSLTNRIDVAPRSGKGRRHVLPLRTDRGASDFHWTKALCGARPRSGWTTDVGDAPMCTSCEQQLAVEAEVAEARVWTAEETMRCAQVAGVLRDEIRSGVFLPGSPFLTQAEARTRFQVAASTTLRAWELLKEQGLITTTPNTTIVADVGAWKPAAVTLPSPPQPKFKVHGTGGYTRGCRCDVCRSAAVTYRRGHRAAARALRPPKVEPRPLATVKKHGTESGYVQGCRAACCREAAAKAVARRRARRRAEVTG